jgi:hypothetical protein
MVVAAILVCFPAAMASAAVARRCWPGWYCSDLLPWLPTHRPSSKGFITELPP